MNALVSSEQIRFEYTSEAVCTDCRVPDEIPEVPDRGAGNRARQLYKNISSVISVSGERR